MCSNGKGCESAAWCCVKLINPCREVAGVAIQGKENLTPGFCEVKTVNLKEHKPQQKLHTLAEAK